MEGFSSPNFTNSIHCFFHPPTFTSLGRRKNIASHDYDMDEAYFQSCLKKTSKCSSKGALLVEILFGI
jgi:hypothetical protein